ncbi:MAG: hypothetical protein EA408_00595 [Marinilabiliales bacterium]|nr:MAG: hypothetical protein EA408_00595 [Marinilabiliales bacterium]
MPRFLIFLLFLLSLPVYSQPQNQSRQISWPSSQNLSDTTEQPSGIIRQEPYSKIEWIGSTEGEARTPVYNELLRVQGISPGYKAELTDMRYEDPGDNEMAGLINVNELSDEIIITQEWNVTRREPVLNISFIPVRLNRATGRPEKLVSFTYRFTREEPVKTEIASPARSYTWNSVLSSGNWVKIKTTSDGVYKLTYEDLIEMGINSPQNVRIFGNGNRKLPKMNNRPRPDDLIENRIYMSIASGSTFGPGDYILFYGQGPVSWNFNEASGLFEHNIHPYSDGTFYFITSSASGKPRITKKPRQAGTPSSAINEFDDYDFHEKNNVNLLKSGREWFGEHFRVVRNYNFSFSFPGIATGREATVRWRAAARSPVSSSFSITAGNGESDQIIMPPVSIGSVISDYVSIRESTFNMAVRGSDIELNVSYSQPTPSAEGWLDYLLINVRRSLRMTGNQLHFRDTQSVGDGSISEFRISGSSSGVRIWDISDPADISELETDFSGNVTTFTDETSRLNQYIAFDNTGFSAPEIIGTIPNQNLHGIRSADMVIVSHPLFLSHANKLADHRRVHDKLEVVVVTPEMIYNEFSSGMPDVSAIRDFMKMLYDRADDESNMVRYLLLFGNGSYDNRAGNPSEMNFIPTYQSPNSIRPTQSFVSDDFFGLLDDDEGEFTGLMDIGVGRLPVTTADQAQAVLSKIIGYNTPDKKGDWQNVLCFIGDDGDNNIHMRDSDIIAQGVKNNYPVYNIDKIYLDAWPKIGTSLGQRYPDVNRYIAERIRRGALIMNYMGHGNELRLADENIIDINDVMSWTNRDRLPVFMTATCEFSRFDNHDRTSAGEMLLLNPNGGAIALYSTTRLVYATPNFFLNQNFYRFALDIEQNGREMRLGDIMRLTKINSGTGINKRNFALLGDPSMKMAIPKHSVEITSVNGMPASGEPDTLRAMGKVSVTGAIKDELGNHLENFDGFIYHTVYDKTTLNTTLGNDGATPFSYRMRNNIIYKGRSTVSGGSFEFSFIVPKDIAYHFGNGKISSFASSATNDASGYFKNIIVGGSDREAKEDQEGPEIKLYMNDPNFVPGGITNQSPRLLAFLTDSSGINTMGSSIGHDITLTMNNDPSTQIILNDYYVADTDSYQSGTIEYPFENLEEGSYNIRLKAWDVFNNSSEASLDFNVTGSDKLTLRNVFNYPNPFTQHTSFHFEHNHPGTGLDVLIQVFTVSGRLVKTIERSINTTGFKPDPISWNGLDQYGDRIGRGVYIYRLRVRTSEGEIAEKYEKLVILK